MKTDGPSIITEGRLVNILCDFQAFDAIPASKYVMRAIIDDGYSKKLLQCTKWDMAAQQLSGQFASSTGFQPDIVWTIFQSLAYGLGWKNTIEKCSVKNPTVPPMHPHRAKVKLGNNASVNDINQYFSSIVELKNDSLSSFGVQFTNISCVWDRSFKDKDFYYYCNVEVTGKLKEFMCIKVISYGFDNSIIDVSSTYVDSNTHKSFGVYNVNPHIQGYMPSDIAKIIVYAE
ncbi:MAG: hypothetical protein MJZ17_06510 [Bacteroidales bacterium]|nr:hypothetical protein [Bacteroidales bacterium]